MVSNKFRIIFFGTPEFAAGPVLDVLNKDFEVVASFRTPQKWTEETISNLKNLNPDFFVVASFGQILTQQILNVPKIAAINIHPSLLPKYRGPSPIQSQILKGETKTGVSFIKMDEEIDHGPIIAQFEGKVESNDTFESLVEKLFKKSAEELTSVLNNYNEDKLIPQSDSDATFTNLLTKESGFVDIEKPPASLRQMIRAYYPWPGVWTKYNLSGKEVIIKLLPDGKVQVGGKNKMSYKDFVNGYKKGKNLLEKLNLLK